MRLISVSEIRLGEGRFHEVAGLHAGRFAQVHMIQAGFPLKEDGHMTCYRKLGLVIRWRLS